jgi:hypothetical protein
MKKRLARALVVIGLLALSSGVPGCSYDGSDVESYGYTSVGVSVYGYSGSGWGACCYSGSVGSVPRPMPVRY